MKPNSYLSIIRGIGILLVITLCMNCKKDYISTNPSQQPPHESKPDGDNFTAPVLASQTRTATYLNNLNNFREVYGDQGYPKAKAGDVAADDGIYAYTRKLNATGVSFSSLALQGFGFTIPEDATIENIAVKVRRFKKGRPSINDYFLSVMQSYSGNPTNGVSLYGFWWRNGDVYPGNYYPDTETEYIFSQSGGGNNGGYYHNQAYQWTPAMVNLPYFGVTINSNAPIGPGTVVIYYDLVEVTVGYSQPATR